MDRRFCILALAALVAAAGCRQKKVETRGTIEEPSAAQTPGAPPPLASTVHMGDARSAGQLVAGFYGIENNAWRWTAKKFTVALHTPAGARASGGVLQFKYSVPQVTIGQLGSLTLSASVNGQPLPSQVVSAPGEYTYQRDVPAAALNGDVTYAEFSLDKAIGPGQTDVRVLGLVAISIGLQAK